MYRIIKRIVAISMVACTHNVASAVAINLEDNFYADPTVEFSEEGFSATIFEDLDRASVLLVNDPFFGDLNVIVPATNTVLTFEYEFNEASGNDDEFRVILFDSDSLNPFDNPLGEFFTGISEGDLISFDLSGFVGQTLGLQFELRSFDNSLNSIVNISNLKLETIVANVPESSATFLLLFGSLLCLGVTRRLM